MSTELAVFDQLKAQMVGFVKNIPDMIVSDQASNSVATGTLKTVKEFQKEIESRRVAMVKPLNDQVAHINQYAKEIAAPLVNAELAIKNKMGIFADQERRKAAELKAKREAEEQAERKKIAEAHAREQAAQMAARQAEQQRLRIEAEEKRKAEQQRLEEEKKTLSAFGVNHAEAERNIEEQLKIAELEAIRKQKEAERSAEIERQEMIAKADRELKELELNVKQQKAAEEAARVKNTRIVWQFEILDQTKIPTRFFVVDERLIRAAISKGERDIPGVRIYEEQIVVAR